MHTTVNKAPVGRNVDETLRILQGYQYVAAVSYTHLTLPTKRIV